MPRHLNTFFLIALFGLCLLTQGRAPRMPELRGHATLEMSQREDLDRAHDDA